MRKTKLNKQIDSLSKKMAKSITDVLNKPTTQPDALYVNQAYFDSLSDLFGGSSKSAYEKYKYCVGDVLEFEGPGLSIYMPNGDLLKAGVKYEVTKVDLENYELKLKGIKKPLTMSEAANYLTRTERKEMAKVLFDK